MLVNLTPEYHGPFEYMTSTVFRSPCVMLTTESLTDWSNAIVFLNTFVGIVKKTIKQIAYETNGVPSKWLSIITTYKLKPEVK
jgi:hypothetical protein